MMSIMPPRPSAARVNSCSRRDPDHGGFDSEQEELHLVVGAVVQVERGEAEHDQDGRPDEQQGREQHPRDASSAQPQRERKLGRARPRHQVAGSEQATERDRASDASVRSPVPSERRAQRGRRLLASPAVQRRQRPNRGLTFAAYRASTDHGGVLDERGEGVSSPPGLSIVVSRRNRLQREGSQTAGPRPRSQQALARAGPGHRSA